ncbi:hypothetical protein ADN00_00740 [Ornatilinea apprima]|uniref:SprT-like domain-containing protein n=1 Tax=Ornatilinea apprima TaxID=1134406 RepID=A0A0P6XLC0_9CHLR|nr:hypothetical protein [Ornatilinea apprima]KPL81086.1 hypothetical protein ADN00_00740 [Ornatilinea apprima]
MLRISGLIKLTNSLHEEFFRCSRLEGKEYQAAIQSSRDDILALTTSIHKKLSAYDSPLNQLTSPARQAYLWLAYLVEEDHLEQHCRSLARAARAFQTALPRKQNFDIRFYNCKYTYSIHHNSQSVHATLHEGFIYAPDSVFNEIVKTLKKNASAKNNPVIKAFIATRPFQNCYTQLNPSLKPKKIHIQGAFHDLNASFERVNRKYFNNKLEKPTLTWSARRTYRTMGCYDVTKDILTVSRSLDHQTVSLHTLDFIMYHELLHKYFGTKSVNGRHISHSARFREAEKSFEHFQQAAQELQRISQEEKKRQSRR